VYNRTKDQTLPGRLFKSDVQKRPGDHRIKKQLCRHCSGTYITKITQEIQALKKHQSQDQTYTG